MPWLEVGLIWLVGWQAPPLALWPMPTLPQRGLQGERPAVLLDGAVNWLLEQCASSEYQPRLSSLA